MIAHRVRTDAGFLAVLAHHHRSLHRPGPAFRSYQGGRSEFAAKVLRSAHIRNRTSMFFQGCDIYPPVSRLSSW